MWGTLESPRLGWGVGGGVDLHPKLAGFPSRVTSSLRKEIPMRSDASGGDEEDAEAPGDGPGDALGRGLRLKTWERFGIQCGSCRGLSFLGLGF